MDKQGWFGSISLFLAANTKYAANIQEKKFKHQHLHYQRDISCNLKQYLTTL